MTMVRLASNPRRLPLPRHRSVRGVSTDAPRRDVVLPPGQRAVEGFPRFGTHLNLPAPQFLEDPAIEIGGTVREAVSVPLARLEELPRCEITADFHCVSGWSATGLRWEGVSFSSFYRQFAGPAVASDRVITHLVFQGLDGYRVVVSTEDALADDVLIADRLNGRPLTADHGGPVRLVSPSQYGYVSAKHLTRVELWTEEPGENYGYAHPLGRVVMRGPLFQRHPRGRVWQEERHRYLPAWMLRAAYAPLRLPIRWLSARGSEERFSAGGERR
jgi:DMSO/TMAO reductase YedYZ molybdopterin-dependent catalytic subunit